MKTISTDLNTSIVPKLWCPICSTRWKLFFCFKCYCFFFSSSPGEYKQPQSIPTLLLFTEPENHHPDSVADFISSTWSGQEAKHWRYFLSSDLHHLLNTLPPLNKYCLLHTQQPFLMYNISVESKTVPTHRKTSTTTSSRCYWSGNFFH